MLHYGLIGRQLSHSFSKTLFEEHFEQDRYAYQLIELDTLDTLRATVVQTGLDGFNVTIPYKTEVLPLLDSIDDTAAKIGAVNTVLVERQGNNVVMKGYNTDAPAFAESIRPLLRQHHRGALVLGTGGAAKAVGCALDGLGVDCLFASRQPHGQQQVDYTTAYSLAPQNTVIVNATPVGMFPNCSQSPWQRPDLLTSQHLCYDLVYNPSPTRFMQEAAQRGAATCDGLAMLRLQAEKSWHIWGLEHSAKSVK